MAATGFSIVFILMEFLQQIFNFWQSVAVKLETEEQALT